MYPKPAKPTIMKPVTNQQFEADDAMDEEDE